MSHTQTMTARTSRSVAKILDQVGKSDPQSLTQRVRKLVLFERQVLACLPQELALHCQVAGVRDGYLRLVTDSASWAARLRFQEPLLIKTLARLGHPETRRIHVKISPKEQARSLPTHCFQLTADNARLLEQTARAIADPKLAEALLRLAKRGAKPRT